VIHVAFAQGGNWWWNGGYGAVDYENNLFSVRFSNSDNSYTLTLKNKQPRVHYLFTEGLQWRELNLR
jgi:hypothetical protein